MERCWKLRNVKRGANIYEGPCRTIFSLLCEEHGSTFKPCSRGLLKNPQPKRNYSLAKIVRPRYSRYIWAFKIKSHDDGFFVSNFVSCGRRSSFFYWPTFTGVFLISIRNLVFCSWKNFLFSDKFDKMRHVNTSMITVLEYHSVCA